VTPAINLTAWRAMRIEPIVALRAD